MHICFLRCIEVVLRQRGGSVHKYIIRSFPGLCTTVVVIFCQQITVKHVGLAEIFSLISKEPEVLLFVSHQEEDITLELKRKSINMYHENSTWQVSECHLHVTFTNLKYDF